MTAPDSQPAAPSKTRRLPFKRTVARRQSPAVSPDAADTKKDEDDDDYLDFFRRSKDVFPMALEEAASDSNSDEKTTMNKRASSPEKHDHKRRKVSLEQEDDGARSSSKSTSSTPRRSPRRKTSLSASAARHYVDDDDDGDDLIMDVKGKGKEITRATKLPTPRQSTSAASTKPPIVMLDDDDDEDEPFASPTPASRARSFKRGSSLVNILDDEDKYDPEDEPEPEPEMEENEPADEFSQWIAKAQEIEEKNGDVVINVMISSRLEGAQPLMVRRRLKQDMRVVFNAWIEHQRKCGLMVNDDFANKLFLTWKGNKIYPYSTAASLGVQVDAQGKLRINTTQGYHRGGLHLEVWDEELYSEYLQYMEKERALQLGYADDNPLGQESEEEEEPAPEKAKGIKIILKSKEHEAFRLTVHDDTTIGTVINAFRKNRNIAPEQSVAIYFDGEKLDEDSVIKDADIDLEETTQLEVHVK
ncbi:ubiquitin-2 like Rad60 SUMO-like-domain-containing protein [Podospora appendiculata]|uniref:Ubiquitin-2 like Rad60 SUMO-like-domain-containing protein n=1 Tax=Podospora appendiculata TaxID=314037 RepID=A0AAE0X883_9PEZI|nr:ubiquitin-2 like Rad60 SUMO-like-domain-containing protein [Podospora appendiculata]